MKSPERKLQDPHEVSVFSRSSLETHSEVNDSHFEDHVGKLSHTEGYFLAITRSWRTVD